VYDEIMVPVDLAHVDGLGKALRTAADLAKHYGIPVIYVGVSAAAPSATARTPEEFSEKLDAFAEEQARAHGIETKAKAMISHDPAIDLDDTLMKAIDETKSDLVVMQSHMPNITDYVWPSNGGALASHAHASVFVVR